MWWFEKLKAYQEAVKSTTTNLTPAAVSSVWNIPSSATTRTISICGPLKFKNVENLSKSRKTAADDTARLPKMKTSHCNAVRQSLVTSPALEWLTVFERISRERHEAQCKLHGSTSPPVAQLVRGPVAIIIRYFQLIPSSGSGKFWIRFPAVAHFVKVQIGDSAGGHRMLYWV